MKNLLAILAILASADVVADEILPSAATRYANRSTDAVPDFQKHVVPLLGRLGCSSAKCHGSFQGQADFRLSLFGFDFQADHAALLAEAYTEDGNRLNTEQPEDSLILLKPTMQIEHEGGQRFELGSWEHHLLLRWIESGAHGVDVDESIASKRTDDTSFPVADVRFFEEKIKPIFEDNCYECHGFNNREGGLQVKTRGLIVQGGNSGPAIVPGDPDASLLVEAVRYSNEDLQMPPGGKLDESEIADLERWVRIGAPWSGQAAAPADTSQVLERLDYEPKEILFSRTGDQSAIRVIAVWEDGQREDVTCLSRFQTNDDSIVTVDRDGVATSSGEGDTHIVALYDNGVVAIPVLRPYGSSAEVTASAPARQADAEQHPIDRLIGEKLSKLGLVPSERCTDAEFLRRVSIDLTGTLPTPDEVLEFLADSSEDKRERLVDELLSRQTYAAWWSNKLCDFTGCSPTAIRNLLEVAQEVGYIRASEWYDWIFERVSNNVPYDDLVAGIMLADLSQGIGEGMPHFWTRQSLEESKHTAMSVAHSFLGIQLQCAECHKHPFDAWTQSDFNDFARFFDSVTPNQGATPTADIQLSLLRSHDVSLDNGQDPREPIMEWMRRDDNPWFARAFVNRVWAGYFHVGIVDPPDQFTPANPPSNPALLDWLTRGFVDHDYDMKWLHRQITSSDAYQRSWKPNATNRHDRRNFSRAIPRRIPAEVVYDALKQTTAASDDLSRVRNNLKFRASGHLSMRMAGTYAMRVFGKPERAMNCDCERVNEPTLLQAVFVQNDPLVRMRLADSNWIIAIEEAEQTGDAIDRLDLISQVWLRTVNRPPSQAEVQRAMKHLDRVDTVAEGISDLMWAMFNTSEFLLNH